MSSNLQNQPSAPKYAIRFGLGAIKSVGLAAMELAIAEREQNGKFKNLYDFVERVDSKSLNKKSIEALAKSGSFDSLHKNRQQIAHSFDLLIAYSNQVRDSIKSSQMNLFGGSKDFEKKPELKKIVDWDKAERLQMEFEAFGYFLNEHPLDKFVNDLKLRGIVFSNRIDEDELEDGSLVKLAGVVANSKHRSGGRGRFAYLYVSDPFGIFEATIFDEAIITANRDIIADGSVIVLECLIRKGEGGSRIMVRNVQKLDEFIKKTSPAKEFFEDVKKQPSRNNQNYSKNYSKNYGNSTVVSDNQTAYKAKQINHPSEDSKNSQPNQNSLPQNGLAASALSSGKLIIEISDKSAILPLKTILLQKQQQRESSLAVKIYLLAKPKLPESSIQNLPTSITNPTKIELSGVYFLSEIDILRLQNLHPNLAILKQ